MLIGLGQTILSGLHGSLLLFTFMIEEDYVIKYLYLIQEQTTMRASASRSAGVGTTIVSVLLCNTKRGRLIQVNAFAFPQWFACSRLDPFTFKETRTNSHKRIYLFLLRIKNTDCGQIKKIYIIRGQNNT